MGERLMGEKLIGERLMGQRLMGERLMGERLMGKRLMGERLIVSTLTDAYLSLGKTYTIACGTTLGTGRLIRDETGTQIWYG